MKITETATIVPRCFVKSSFVSLWNEWKLQTKIFLILSPTVLANCHLQCFTVFFPFRVECKNSHYRLNGVVKHCEEWDCNLVRCKHLQPCNCSTDSVKLFGLCGAVKTMELDSLWSLSPAAHLIHHIKPVFPGVAFEASAPHIILLFFCYQELPWEFLKQTQNYIYIYLLLYDIFASLYCIQYFMVVRLNLFTWFLSIMPRPLINTIKGEHINPY